MYVVILRSFHSPLNPQHSFSVQPAPSDTLALSNRLIVHPSDFRDGEHVLVKGEFPLTVKYVPVHSSLRR